MRPADPDLLIEVDGPVLRVTFNRPDVHNAATARMYDGIVAACERVDSSPDIRLMVLRGAGGKSFVAGTDIKDFTGFDGPRGVEYERRINTVLSRLLAVRVPVIATVEGFCLGGGLLIASCADIRIAGPNARFGFSVARTLGNTLSAASYALIIRHFGHARTMDMALTARLLDAREAEECGYSRSTSDPAAETEELVRILLTHAPLTLAAAKELTRRLHAQVTAGVDDSDVVERVYGSNDFASGVAAFRRGRRATWEGAGQQLLGPVPRESGRGF
ncbi:enoyl-CoA hydratase/carnithine racemase [Nocardioides sp. J9]|uniref:enoyl-CoA hydratase n=1 Tax=Nocardioides sp. J9 TaxID=935844 RepID=UPI0011A8544B|nr:enoyl-CoA hydratase [Nocardioides sp. J9]TWH01760.1 enoyl-CoA hydratase/carnithine racemase [Nocardioides sp. J9]